ncbi:hypothetical protein EON62_05860, partial [archaeon]
YGSDRVKFLEKLVVADVAEMKKNEAKLTLVTNEKGGIIDDSVIANHGDYMYAPPLHSRGARGMRQHSSPSPCTVLAVMCACTGRLDTRVHALSRAATWW